MLFNKDTGKKWDDIDHPHFNEFYITKWIPESDMTDEEKKADEHFHVRGGYLKKFTYKEAWKNFWRDTDENNKKKFLALPNFDAEIFKEITGIDLKDDDMKGTEVEVKIKGKKYIAIIQ